MSNAELVARLERQFAGSVDPVAQHLSEHRCLEIRQLVKSAEVRIRHRKEQEKKAHQKNLA